MTRRGRTPDDLAVLLDCTPGSIHNWLSGFRVPDPPMLVALAKALRVTPSDLTLVDEDSERLHDLRIHAGLLQGDVAELAGVTQSSLSKIERGVATPREDVLNALSRAYGVTPERVAAAWGRAREDRRRHAER